MQDDSIKNRTYVVYFYCKAKYDLFGIKNSEKIKSSIFLKKLKIFLCVYGYIQ